ncbi:hypothetical protein BC828DRAFT_237307 [Blastocladiella britannica]|nr:hypothetical protein BC828DRAFT_237307 [Blastocladiella britannica]
MIERLQVLANDDDWPEDGTQICEVLCAIPYEIMGLGDPMAKMMKLHTAGHLPTVMKRFTIEYPELMMSSMAPMTPRAIADAAPDLATEYLRLTVVPMFARMRMAWPLTTSAPICTTSCPRCTAGKLPPTAISNAPWPNLTRRIGRPG